MSSRTVGPPARWWLRAAAVLVLVYVVASQTLMGIPDWSVAGFALAALLAALLVYGRVIGVYQFRIGRWFFIPAIFGCYVVWRGVGSQYGSPVNVLSQVASAYLGGMGVAAALRAGVPFRVLAFAQVVSSVCQIAAGSLGIGIPDPGDTEGRYAGLTGNANEFGLQLTLGACLIWLLPKESGFFACLFALGAVAYGLITSGSRQALLVVLAFVVLVLVAVVSTKKKKGRLIVVGVLVGLCAIGVYLAPLLLEYGGEITAIQRAVGYREDSSYQKRASFIREGLNLWQKAPLLGNGVDAFRDLSGEGTYAHNDYVELLCDLGLVGALLFYAIHANVLLSVTRLYRSLSLCCWILVLLLLCLDTASVGYKRKQTVMILMVIGSLGSVVGRRYPVGFEGEWPAGHYAHFPPGSRRPLPRPLGDWPSDPPQQRSTGYS